MLYSSLTLVMLEHELKGAILPPSIHILFYVLATLLWLSYPYMWLSYPNTFGLFCFSTELFYT